MDCMDDRTYNRRRFGPAVHSRFRDSLVGVWGMKRRTFLGSLALLPAALAVQEGPPEADPVEQFTTPALPTIALSHLGFRPEVSKTLIVRLTPATPKVESCLLEDVVPPFKTQIELHRSESDFGPVLVGDLSALNRPGIYQVMLGQERYDQPQIINGVQQWEHSVPFFVRDDVWRRTLPKAVGYYRYQRCGVEVPGVHPACHLDDARRRDNGEHVDLVGGWHDAGDVRKWMDVTMLNGIALLKLRLEVAPREGVSGETLLEEVRFGNRYFLKMQDRDGRVWHDTAGGVNGDNSDNHWTDNIIGTADDRYVDTSKPEVVSAIFVALEALAAQSYAASDSAYSAQCLAAAQKAWRAWPERGSRTLELAWWIMAGCELWRATHDSSVIAQMVRAVEKLMGNQVQSYVGGQRTIRGFWLEDSAAGKAMPNPYVDLVFSAMPPIALLEFTSTFPEHALGSRCVDSARMYVEDYVLPMTEHNAYRIMPVGLYRGAPTAETYRPVAGEFTYRYFLPVRKQFWWQGGNCHLAQHALLLARLAQFETSGGRDSARSQDHINLAYRQLEWIMGANPFSACLMTGEGVRNPYPHSRFVGLIPGGIMNGIAGNPSDEPVLDLEYGIDWRTCEYWSPHVAFYIWANAVLKRLHA